jgi:hypothetical protein
MPSPNAKTLFENQDEPVAPTGDVRADRKPARKSAGATRTISDLYLADAIVGVKESANCRSLEELRERLVAVLGQNSAETRLRSARFVIRWFFPDGLDGVARKTWAAYQDEKVLVDVLRYLYLSQEPVMGECVADCLFPVEVGMRVPTSLFDRFLDAYYSGQPTKKTVQRLKTNLMKLGFLERPAGNEDQLVSVNPTKTALLLLTHYLFAPAGARTVELKRILADPFWEYLGLKSEDAVRAAFREADAAGVLGKYVVADQLEQITTRWSLDEFLANKPRL